MVCADGFAMLLHFRSVKYYYFLLCVPWIDLPFPSFFMYLLSSHTQEEMGNNFASNKRSCMEAASLLLCSRWVQAVEGFYWFCLGVRGMHCVFTQAWWEVTAQKPPWSTLCPCEVPYCLCPLLLTATSAAAGQMAPLPLLLWLLDVVSLPPTPSAVGSRSRSMQGGWLPVVQSCF